MMYSSGRLLPFIVAITLFEVDDRYAFLIDTLVFTPKPIGLKPGVNACATRLSLPPAEASSLSATSLVIQPSKGARDRLLSAASRYSCGPLQPLRMTFQP